MAKDSSSGKAREPETDIHPPPPPVPAADLGPDSLAADVDLI